MVSELVIKQQGQREQKKSIIYTGICTQSRLYQEFTNCERKEMRYISFIVHLIHLSLHSGVQATYRHLEREPDIRLCLFFQGQALL